MNQIKIFILLFCLLFISAKSQIFEGAQFVPIEKYQGKDYILEAKIYYQNELKNDSWIVLGSRSMNEKSVQIDKTNYNENAEDDYKWGDWSNYEISGKIDKKAKYLAVGFAIAGNGNYYVDDFKLYIKDGKDKIEIPLVDTGFEGDNLKIWITSDKTSKLSLTTDKVFSGKQSLFVDNSDVKVSPTLGNNEALGKYMEVNGVKLYYEVYGKGEPLLLLNGNNTSMSKFANQLEDLSKEYMVIGLDSRGQGKSTGDDTKLTYELMSEDVNAFLDKMNLKNVNILGWSDGGNIAVILARDHPDKVKKMAIMGTVLYNNETSVKPEINELIKKQLAEWDAQGKSKNSMDYRLKVLLLTEPNINPDSLNKIKVPTLVMAGEDDVMPYSHTKLIADKIPNSKMVIFKGGDHEAPEKMPQLFNKTVLKFFEAKN